MYQDFAYRHNGPRDFQIKEMLEAIGVESLDELISQTVPADIMLDKPLALAPAVSESEYLTSLKEIAAKNKPFRSMIGMGFYGTASPSVILRNIFENPSWYTSYTPYQSEISQARGPHSFPDYDFFTDRLPARELFDARRRYRSCRSDAHDVQPAQPSHGPVRL